MVDKRKLNGETRNFKPSNISIEEDGRISFALIRKDDGCGGLEFISIDGYDKTRNKTIVPDKAFYRIDLPKGYRLVNEDSFRATELMYKYTAELFRCGGDEKKAVAESDVSPITLAKWKKKDGFLDWQTSQIQDLSKSIMPKIISSAYKQAEKDPQMMKYLMDKFGVREEQSEMVRTNIIDFSGNWKQMSADYDVLRENGNSG